MSFFVELWESVFTPGTTPALITATHASFIMLIFSLFSLVFITKNIHFFNLLVIACLLYAAVVWFIKELEQAKMKSNQELEKESEESEENSKSEPEATSSSIKPTSSPKKRKV